MLASEVFDASIHGAESLALRQRALRASRLAARIAGTHPDAGAATTAALLADIAYLLPDVRSVDVSGAEEELSPNAHAELGASLLGLWALPVPIVDAVANHHAPQFSARGEFGTVGIVHVAVALANGVEPDQEFLEAHGMASKLSEWKSFCGGIGVERL